MEEIKNSVLINAPKLFHKTPVLFAYLYGSYAQDLVHPFSDLDIGIFIERASVKNPLDLELSLSLAFDNQIPQKVETEIRIINDLPLMVKGNIITTGSLIYCVNDSIRIDFETRLRSEYFDYLPVHHHYQSLYRQSMQQDRQ